MKQLTSNYGYKHEDLNKASQVECENLGLMYAHSLSVNPLAKNKKAI